MTKEEFVADTLILMRQNDHVPFRQLDPNNYGISRATAYRALKALKDAGILTGNFRLSQETRDRLCEECKYHKHYFKQKEEERNRRRHGHFSQR
ncbi:MAG: hypothetical protein JSV12_00910 [Candidatus Bathyarchaeota archaeon]|nr:MAG: hypothetical protein JSV12_00910 [Candidatus Bathyarchaeota archaeon]